MLGHSDIEIFDIAVIKLQQPTKKNKAVGKFSYALIPCGLLFNIRVIILLQML